MQHVLSDHTALCGVCCGWRLPVATGSSICDKALIHADARIAWSVSSLGCRLTTQSRCVESLAVCFREPPGAACLKNLCRRDDAGPLSVFAVMPLCSSAWE
jgi:hypothetical protein